MEERCRLYARACSEAVFMDFCLPQPGLTTCSDPRPDAPREAMAGCTWAAYEACLEACMGGLERRAVFHEAWLAALRAVLPRGNACMGSLLLLSLIGNSLGYSLAVYGSDDPVHVMGSSRIIVEGAGRGAARAFYEALRLAGPSYLARISYSGLPDATQPLGRGEPGIDLYALAREASLYDPVLRELDRLLEASAAYGLELLMEWGCWRGMRRLLACIACSYGDLLLKRKLGVVGEEWCRACRGEPVEPEGPAGSAADIAVAAAALCAYYAGITRPPSSSTTQPASQS